MICKDYDREYSIQEVFEFEEGTEFVAGSTVYKIKDNEIFISSTTTSFIRCCANKFLVNTKFKLKRKEKEVEFTEALEAYSRLKTIKCFICGKEYIYKPEFKNNFLINNLSYDRIKKGKWYILD